MCVCVRKNTYAGHLISHLPVSSVDKELSKFLEKEISYEENAANKAAAVNRIEGFEVTTEGADVTLTRKTGNET